MRSCFYRLSLNSAGAKVLCFIAIIAFMFAAHLQAAIVGSDDADSLMNKAQAAHAKGDDAVALELANKAVQAAPRNPQCYYVRGFVYGAQAEHAKAISDYDQAIKLEARGAALYQLRGLEHFKLGHIKESIQDFDKYLEFVPKQAPHHWQRGIALYYAGRYDDGRKQFESHQTVNPADVENAVWHFLCVARLENAEKARASLIPIKGDSRVPMSQIYDLFAGKAKPEQVFEAAKAASKSDDALFYANLYVGLYYEATGDKVRANEYINKAASDLHAQHYMGDVARVHAELLRKPKSK
jgi:lipoprotein NlpI